MVNEREIAAMQEQLQKNGYEGNYERSQPTHPEISAIWISEFVHIAVPAKGWYRWTSGGDAGMAGTSSALRIW